MSAIAQEAQLSRQNLYRMLSAKATPVGIISQRYLVFWVYKCNFRIKINKQTGLQQRLN
ncbi:hypothetical protein H0X48_03200 [Candidatus Dependentiae bacterium]|nr:hypothetical protein [Candidatus Dependentiae bacterium]